jgi:phospholipid transport system substrate-binding protein
MKENAMRALFGTLAALLVIHSALAQAPAPDALIRQIADEVIAAIKTDSAIRKGDWSHLSALVEDKIVPHFDFRRTTRMAMGAGWRRASPEQQNELTRQFKQLLVRTYSGALASYADQTVEVRPLRAKPEDNEVTVRCFVRQSGTEPVAIEYDMERTESGWKVFDVRVAGVSLVATYRTAFAEEVRNHGVDGLIELLSRKNREGGVNTVRM